MNRRDGAEMGSGSGIDLPALRDDSHATAAVDDGLGR
jgi:hypothetical protein